MSASRTPTRWPSCERATARFAASDDLPTPPLPLATASTRQSAGSRITPSRSGAPPRSFCGSPAAPFLREPLPLLRRHDVEGELSSRHAGDTGESLLHLLLERVAQRTAGDGENDRERNDAVVQLQVAHHVELGDRPPELRNDHLLERLQDLVAIDFHYVRSSAGRAGASATRRAPSSLRTQRA